ncbi:MAG: cytochrome c biogenesis protein CcdA [Flavobacteriaceae bacterium]|nr:cytochrome c biogenesis protein CcdA [Flavobacteriaceae bacterium]
MRIIPLILNLLFASLVLAQNPVTWTTQAKQIDSLTFDVVITANIEEKWHLYATEMPEDGPLPTEFSFQDVTPIGLLTHSELITGYDPIFEMELSYFDNKATFYQTIKVADQSVQDITVELIYQACDDKLCIFRDEQLLVSLTGDSQKQQSEDLTALTADSEKKLKIELKNTDLLTTNSDQDSDSSSIWNIFLLGFFGGLIALLTPCVFPMIPLTVSFFTKQSSTKSQGLTNALLYAFFIVLIYALLSLPFHFLDSINPEILNTISTNIWLNIFFFLIFLFFAFSFFGYYELTLPSSWANRLDFASNKAGGFIGIFLMALTLAIVSFSCTGPILGSLLAGSLSSTGGATQLSMGMTGFGLALALPFGLFALFPNLLQSLPKSGGWMNTLKVVLGFIELALAIKFLSNADLVAHWGILKREIFIGLWILIFVVMIAYLFGLFRFPHEAKKPRLGTGRILLAVVSLSFVVYLVPGTLPNSSSNSLKLLAGFPPPTFYSIYAQDSDCPLNLDCYKDYDKGVAVAKAANKPILLDFTGWACVNCRKVEENVWSDPEIYRLINEELVLISLYVDDRESLADEDQFTLEYTSGRIRNIETIGQKWAAFQAINFNSVAQPHYILMMPDGTLLAPPQQYTDIPTYLQWLQNGLANVPRQALGFTLE